MYMNKHVAKKLKERNLKIAPVDKETSEMIKDLAKLTNEYPSDIIKAAVSMLAKSLGHQVVLRDPDSSWELVINSFREYKGKFNLKPQNERK